MVCYATVGQVGNIDHENVSIGKAGRNRWLGWRPHNRAASTNPESTIRMAAARARRRAVAIRYAGIADQGLQDTQSQVDRQIHRPAQAEGRKVSTEHAAENRHE